MSEENKPAVIEEVVKPIIIVLTRVELGGGASIIADIISGKHRLKQDYLKALRQIQNIVKAMAPLHRIAIPQGATLAVIEGGIYVEDQEVYYKFHWYSPPPEEIDAPSGF